MPEEENGPIILTDFSGGLNQKASIYDIKPNECLEAINVKFYRPEGCISPRPGRKWMVGQEGNLMTSAMSSDIIGMTQWHTSAGKIVPMVATCCASNIPAQIGFLSGNSTDGALFHGKLLHSDDTMFYSWVDGVWHNPVSGMSGLMFSADSVFFVPHENQVIFTWCPSGVDNSNVDVLAPPFLWNGRSASAVSLQISSEPLLGPDDDRSTGSADRQISTMLALSAARCGTFQGYLFLMNTVEMELMSSDGSATGYFSAAWHPYRVRWANPGASSVRSVDASAGGPAWNYSDFADFDPGDAYGITGYAVIGDEMLVFKKDKMYAISWVGGDELFNYRKVSDKIGCVSHKSIVAGPSMAAWAAKDGIYVWDGNQPKRVSDKIKDIYGSINLDRRHFICGGAWDELKQLWWSIPVETSDRNNQGIIADINSGDVDNIAWSTATLSVGNLMGYDKAVVEDSACGLWGTGYDGWMYRYDEAINYEASGTYQNSDGLGSVKMSSGIPYSWKSGWSVFEKPQNIKRLKRVRTVFGRRSDSISMAIRKNWETDGTAVVNSFRPLSGRDSSYTGDLVYDKANFTCQGQSLQLHYYTSAGPAISTVTAPPSTHHWTIHEIGLDVDLMGTHFYGSI